MSPRTSVLICEYAFTFFVDDENFANNRGTIQYAPNALGQMQANALRAEDQYHAQEIRN